MGSSVKLRLQSTFAPSRLCTSSQALTSNMEAIKKKMQAMKVEKDNACDRVDVEEACKAARLRASKGEDEVDELMAKARQLETELDLTAERFGIVSLQLEEKEKALAATELEMNALNRRVSGLEEDLEKTEEKMVQAASKLDKAGTAADDSERAKKVFQNKADEEKANQREKMYKDQIKTLTAKLKQAEAR